MGRYYNGDIEGKFWFGLQSSIAADRFGVEGNQPNYVEYYFEEEDLPTVEAEIKSIEDSIDEKKIESYLYGDKGKYKTETLEENGITDSQLSDYADLLLGRKIRDCVKETGQCNFDAEL
jgi:hypothetical protein